MKRTAATAAGLASIALAGCNTELPPGNIANVAEANAVGAIYNIDEPDAAPDNQMGNQAGVSIMRPDVAEEVAPPPAPEPPKPETRTISFAQGGEKLSDAARAALTELLAKPLMAQGGPITLRGHSDSKGYDGDNMVMSRRRAEAVRDYLVKNGVAAERITVIALGENRPVAPNMNADGTDYEEGRRQNRRVDVEIAPGAQAAAAKPGPSPAPTATLTKK